MALKFKTSGASDDALAQLLQLSQFSQQRKDRKQRGYASMQAELGEGIEGIYDNNILSQRRQHFDRYYSNNKDDMDEDTLARFDMMKQKYDLQEQANNDFKKGMDYSKNIGGQVEDALIDYSNVQGYDENQVNILWNELNPDSKVEKTIQEKRNDLRVNRMDSVKELTDAYSGFSGEFRASHGQRLGTAGFRQDASYIQNLNEMFTFGIVQAEDDYVFDSQEASAMKLGIEQGSFQPIVDYRTKESSRNKTITDTQRKDMKENYEAFGDYQTLLDSANKFQRLVQSEDSEDNQKAAAMVDTVWYVNANDEEIMYDSIVGAEEFLSQMEDLEKLQGKHKQNILNIDDSYNKREGVSWLQDNNTNEDIKYFFEEKPPPTPPTTPTPTPTPTPTSESNIQSIDIKKDVATSKSWASPELTKTGEKLNKIKDDIDTFTVSPSPEISTGKLNEMLNKPSNEKVSYNDLKDIEKLYNDDLEDMNTFYEEEQSMKRFGIKANDERRVKLRRKIGKLYNKWHDRMLPKNTNPDSKRAPAPNSALSSLKSGLGQIQILEDRHNKLKDKYDKDLKRSQK